MKCTEYAKLGFWKSLFKDEEHDFVCLAVIPEIAKTWIVESGHSAGWSITRSMSFFRCRYCGKESTRRNILPAKLASKKYK